MIKHSSPKSFPGAPRSGSLPDRPRFHFSKRVSLVTLTFIFSLCSVGLMEDFQQNIWLKNYLLIAALLWGNLLIYLSFYPQWGQRLIAIQKTDYEQK